MRHLLWIMAVVLVGFSASAATNYVVPVGTIGADPIANYTNWAHAATNIQDAVNAADVNNTILVSNGTYILTNQILVAKVLTIQSYNNGHTDWTNTIINGNYPTTTNRCFQFASGGGATLDGFTITNGNSETGYGGGVYLNGVVGTIIKNCRITGNQASRGGGIINFFAVNCIVSNCSIIGNIASNATLAFGGGVHLLNGGEVKNCVIQDNKALPLTVAQNGGGVYVGTTSYGRGILRDSVISGNSAYFGAGVMMETDRDNGGGVFMDALVTNCVIINNRGARGGGVFASGYPGPGSEVVRDCTISNNYASESGGGIELLTSAKVLVQNCLIVSNRPCGVYNGAGQTSMVENCTIVSNIPYGVTNKASQICMLANAIVYFNGTDGINNWSGGGTYYWTNSCTFPEGANWVSGTTNDPLFVDRGGNWRLSSGSPCIDRGTNLDWTLSAVDLDRKVRIRYGIVDMGAYEHIRVGTIISVY